MLIDDIKKYIEKGQYDKAMITTEIIAKRDFEGWITKLSEEAAIRQERLTEEQIAELNVIFNSVLDKLNLDNRTEKEKRNSKKEAPSGSISEMAESKAIKTFLDRELKVTAEEALAQWAKTVKTSMTLMDIYNEYESNIIVKNHIVSKDPEVVKAKVIEAIEKYIRQGIEGNDQFIKDLSEELGRTKTQMEYFLERYILIKKKAIDLLLALFELVSRAEGVKLIIPDLQTEVFNLEQLFKDTDEMIKEMVQ